MLDIENSKSCAKDYLCVKTIKKYEKIFYCGSKKRGHEELYSRGKLLELVFKTNNKIGRKGFEATIEAVQKKKGKK